MYNALLTKVTKVIDQHFKVTNQEDSFDEFFNLMFHPEAYAAQQEEKRKKENNKQKLILGVTAIAVIGEGYHLAKRSGVIDKVFKR